MATGSLNRGFRGPAPTFRFTGIPTPKFNPIDTSGISALEGRLAETDRLSRNPLSAPGAVQGIVAAGGQLARSADAARGQAQGRAASLGTAGFAGSLAQVGADIQAQQGQALAQFTADTTKEIFERARAEGLSVTQAIAAARNQADQLRLQQEQITAETAAKNAELRQRAWDAYQQDLLERAKLAEQSRQFDTSIKQTDTRLEDDRGVRLAEERRRLLAQQAAEREAYRNRNRSGFRRAADSDTPPPTPLGTNRRWQFPSLLTRRSDDERRRNPGASF